MSSEKTLYQPCKAAHSPKRLENTVAECIANMIISGSVPQEIKKSSVKSTHNCDHLCCLQLDKIILGASEHEEQQDMLKGAVPLLCPIITRGRMSSLGLYEEDRNYRLVCCDCHKSTKEQV
ncbi:hypothetical protein Avbf_02342 [Armadillidium vulgare]|nr:hypothetical protein Avbf_02342 [Armadillidium vulgare]